MCDKQEQTHTQSDEDVSKTQTGGQILLLAFCSFMLAHEAHAGDCIATVNACLHIVDYESDTNTTTVTVTCGGNVSSETFQGDISTQMCRLYTQVREA